MGYAVKTARVYTYSGTSTLVAGAYENIIFKPSPNSILSVGSGVILRNCSFDFGHILTSADHPSQFVEISGDDILIDGLSAKMEYPFLFDSSSVGRLIGFTGASSNVRIANCKLLNGFYGVHADGVQLSDIHILNNKISGARNGVLLNNLVAGSSNISINNNRFDATPWTLPITSKGEILVCGGFDQLALAGTVTNSHYDSGYIKGLRVNGNVIPKTSHRAIYLINVIGVECQFNVVNDLSLAGDNTDQNYSDDAIVIEMARGGIVTGNYVGFSGENSFDLFGCKDLVVSGNNFLGADVCAFMFDNSDAYTSGRTAAAGAAANQWRVNNDCNERIAAVDNYLSASNSALEVRHGRNITARNRIGKFWNGRPSASGGARYDFAIVPKSNSTIANGAQTENIDFSGTTKDRVTRARCAADFSSNIVRFDYAHQFVTGDRINFFVNDPSTEALPTSLDALVDYYVRVVNATSIMLATSKDNSNAASPTTITFGATATGVCYIDELEAGRVYVSTSDIIGLVYSRPIAEVSTLAAISANTSYDLVHNKGSRNEINLDLAVTAGSIFGGTTTNLNIPRYVRIKSGSVYDPAVTAGKRGFDVQYSDRYRIKYRTGDFLIPTSSVSAAGVPGTLTSGISTGFARTVIM